MDSADTMFGVMFGLLGTLFLVVVFAIGQDMAIKAVAGQCAKVGKVELVDKVYECKPIKEGVANG